MKHKHTADSQMVPENLFLFDHDLKVSSGGQFDKVIFSLYQAWKHALIFKTKLDRFSSLLFDNKACQQSIVLQLRFYRQDSDFLDQ